MSLGVGTHLGSLKITALIGRGGMGEVYRAHDLKLKRDVAIKVLPEEFSRDPDRVSRFQREAEVLAALNHPNIASIYDLLEAKGTRYLVLELIDGETLADRIQRGPIPVEEALEIAKHLCEGLEAAHEKGIIHRDLKPANVKLTPDGRVKVLDFGLAKAYQAEPANADLSNSPTMMSEAVTGAMILGTAAYMSPEQARGRPLDHRTDVFAFGCVLYEMLAGRPAFVGDDLAEILGRVVTGEPDWARLPAGTPWLIKRLLRRLLKKDPRQRLGDIRDARLDIEEALVEPVPTPATPLARITPRAWPASFAVAAALIVLLAIPSVRHLREVPLPAPSEIRLELTTPPTTDSGSLAISPDGQKIVFVATSNGRPSLALRTLDSGSARVLAGTDGAWLPFWSPDSRSLGFFADAKLKRIDIDGGTPQDLANASSGNGGTWNSDGVILYSPYPGRPILRVSAKGGPSSAVTRIEESQGVDHREPYFLPDGRHFLYSVFGGDIYVGQLDGTEAKRLIEGAKKPIYVDSGYLLFVRQETLFAQKFDPIRLELGGNPFPVVEHVEIRDPTVAVAASATGTIVYRSASGNHQSQFVWLDRSGKEIGKVGGSPDTAEYVGMPSISPDGSRLALMRSVAGNPDVWFLEMARGVLTRFTSGPVNDVFPIWSPDGARLVFSSTRKGGVHDLYQKAANGAGTEELLLATPTDKAATDWSSNGRYLLYFTYDSMTQNDIWALPLEGDQKPFPIVRTEFEETNGQFAPDGNWIAYQSNESGRSEIYVYPFPGPGQKTRISTDGGAQVRWRRDGKELFYLALDGRLMAVPIRLPAAGQNVQAGTPVSLGLTQVFAPVEVDTHEYFVSPDGQRFLVNNIIQAAGAQPISLILNWKPPVR